MKKFFLILIIVISVALTASEIDLHKISTVYKTDYFQNSFVNGDYFYTAGDRGIEKLLPDTNGDLQLVDEINLRGDIDMANKVGNSLFVTTYIGNIFANAPLVYQIFYRISIDENNFTLLDSTIISNHSQFIDYERTAGNYLLVNKYFQGYEGDIYVYDENSLEPICTYSSSFLFSPFFRIMNDKYLLTYELDNPQERNHVHVFDLTDIYNIEYMGDVYFSGELEGVDYISSIPNKIDENTMVMASWSKYVFFDITDPLNWQRLGEMDFPDGLATSEPTFYSPDILVMANAYNRVLLYNISDLSNPIELSYVDYDRGNLEGPLRVYNNYLYTPSGSSGVDEFKIENNTISHIGDYPEIPLLGYNRIKDDYLIATGFYKGLFIFDISDLDNPQFISKIMLDDSITDFRTDFENGVLVATSVNYNGNKFFSIYDISNINNPILTHREQIIDYATITMNYPKIAQVYVNMYQIVGFDIFDIDNPIQTYTYNYDAAPGITYLYNDHMYIKKDQNHIGVINNIFDEPQLVDTIYDYNIAFLMHTQGDFFYTRHDDGHFEINTNIYSLANLNEPELIFDIPHIGGELLYMKDNLFISMTDGMMNFYDLNNNFDFYNPIKSINIPYYVSQLKFYEKDNTKYMLWGDPTYCDIYSYTLDSSDVNGTDVALSKTTLFDNYPNPFNPSTTILFNLAKFAKDTKIVIYNIKGQKVKQLKVDNEKLGFNQVVWNGKNDNGKKVTSGVYLYQLKQKGKTVASKKMIMVK